MALTKITAAIIEDGAITASALSNNSIGITQLNVSDGTSGQFLKTDGSGNLSFASVPAGYTDSDVESYLSGGTGVTFSSGVISIGQDVATSSTPTFGNITTTGYIAGPATFTIDPAAVGDNTGTVVIAGNLQVDGTTTTINSTTMEVDDLNITLASGAANAAAANGAGITVDGASATITYDGTNDAWSFNKNVGIGTTAPERALHIVGGLHLENDNKISWDQANGTLRNAIYVDSGDDMIIGDPNFDDIYFSTGGKTKTVVIKQTTGNVGIGTTSPAAGLQVSKGLTNAGGPPAGASTAAACFGNDGSDDNYGLVLGADGNGLGYISAQRTDGTATTYPLSIQPNGGNVGIGTTSPNNYANLSTLTIDGTNGSVLDFESGGTLTGEIFSSSASLAISFKDDSDCVFYGNITERMRITNAGNVGIGTSSPSTRTHIYSSASSTPLIVESTANTYVGIKNTTQTAYIGAVTGHMTFENSGAERMRLTSAGDLSIGTTSPESDHRLFVQEEGSTRLLSKFKASGEHAFIFIDSAHSNTYLPVLIFQRASTSYGAVGLQRASNGYTESTMDVKTYASHPVTISTNDTKRMTVDASGNIGAPSGSNIYNASDARLKRNISVLSNSLDIISNLNPVKFNWIENFSEHENDRTLYGFVAQEVQDVFPDAVESFGTGDDIDVDGTVIENPLTVRDKFFIPVLVKAIQEQQTIIDDLKSRLDSAGL